jgi:hypothetical protein
MSAPPLTHHEILALVEPFTRCGRHVDLAASNRLERRLVFKPVEHAFAGHQPPVLRETLALEKLVTGTFRLTRVLEPPGGPQATLTALGENAARLLADFHSVDPRQHFRIAAGVQIARSYDLEYDPRPPGDHRSPAQPVFTRGVAHIEGLRATLALPSTRGVAAAITLETTSDGGPLDLPEDLLAVLGWDWVRLIATKEGWKSKLRLRGGTARRSRGAEAALELAARHLARTLAEPPSRFHERWAAARWGVVFRRSIPVLTLLLLIATIAILPHVIVDPNPALRLLLFDVPTALIVLSFCLQELPTYEIPPRPRRCAAASWRRAGGSELPMPQSSLTAQSSLTPPLPLTPRSPLTPPSPFDSQSQSQSQLASHSQFNSRSRLTSGSRGGEPSGWNPSS